VEPGLDELDWGEPGVCAVGPVHVIVVPPVLGEDLGLQETVNVTPYGVQETVVASLKTLQYKVGTLLKI
jgi:hypothetical protein